MCRRAQLHGGKDGQCAALVASRYLDSVGHRGQRGERVVICSHQGEMEWDDSQPMCELLADHLALELMVVRARTGLLERWRGRWHADAPDCAVVPPAS